MISFQSSGYGSATANPGGMTVVPTFICPSDFTMGTMGNGQGVQNNGWGGTNYVGNVMVFSLSPQTISQTFVDGTSNTVMIGESYLNAGGQTLYSLKLLGSYGLQNYFGDPFNQPGWAATYDSVCGGGTVPGFGWYTAGITANNPSYWFNPGQSGIAVDTYYGYGGDVWPQFGAFQMDFCMNPAVNAVPANPGNPFQCATPLAQTTASILSSPHQAMQVALGDGSVRSVSPGVSGVTFVRACIPNDGNPMGSDW